MPLSDLLKMMLLAMICIALTTLAFITYTDNPSQNKPTAIATSNGNNSTMTPTFLQKSSIVKPLLNYTGHNIVQPSGNQFNKPAQPNESEGAIDYTVKKGDTLYKIGQ